MLRVLALLLALASPLPVLGQQAAPGFEARLEKLAAEKPSEPYELPADAPSGFRTLLEGRGYPKTKPTNSEALALYRGPGAAPARAKIVKGPVSAAPAAAPSADPKGLGPLFDGSPKAPAEGTPPPVTGDNKQDSSHSGLRFFGLEMGMGSRDPIREDNDPYLRKGAPQLLDWDIRARVALDGLGARALYRHPEGLRSFAVGFMKYWDIPAALGLDSARDKVFSWVGAYADKPIAGFEASVSGAVNQYLGGATTFDWREATWKDRWYDRKLGTVEAGVSPLGDNPGKRWNVTVLASGNYERLQVKEGDYAADKKGFGYAMGVAFQESLHLLPIPILQPNPKPGALFQWDRFRTRLDVANSQVLGPSIALSAEASFLLFKHILLTGGAKITYWGSPDWADPQAKTWDPAAILGLDLR